MTGKTPRTAIVLAAGIGKRMRPLTDSRPKPMVEVQGRALVDHVLDRLSDAGVPQAIVNVHHFADMMEAHVRRRARPAITISDERDMLLETGGGPLKVLDQLSDPFYAINADTIWIEGVRQNLLRMADQWDETRMDALLLVAPTTASVGYDGLGDFAMDQDGRLSRRSEGYVAPFVYAGAQIASKALFAGAPERTSFSVNRMWDKAMERGRLFGIRLEGLWMHVGTPDAIGEAEACYARSAA